MACRKTYSIEVSNYRITQHPFRSFSNDKSAARVAASKTSSTPSPVNEEHSRYLRAPICAAVSLPSLGVRKRSDFFLISSMATGSSRRSFFKPTRMMGTSGHRSLASSIHYGVLVVCNWNAIAEERHTFVFTLSNESGVSTAKPISNTCALEYAKGRSRS